MKFLKLRFISLFFSVALILIPDVGFTNRICMAATADPVIQVGSEVEFPPFAIVDKDGQAAGFSVDLIRAVADTMGLSIAFTTGPWDRMWNGLVSGRFDVLPIVASSPDRKRLIDFSLPHTETFDAFFVRNSSPAFPNIQAAKGKAIIVMRSDAAHHELLERKFKGEIVPVNTIPEGLTMLASGKHDALLCSKLIGTLVMEKNGIKGITAGPLITDYKRVFVFGVKKGSDELREKLNQGLLIIKSNGDYERIYERWLRIAKPIRSTPFKTIIVDNYHPYTFANEKGVPDGFSVDLAKAVTKVMAMDLEIRVDTWQKAQDALLSGEIDFLPMMAYSKERDQVFDFSGPHTIGYDAFFTRTDAKKIRSINDLRGKQIIVMKNDQAHNYLLHTGIVNDSQLIFINSLPEGLRLLSAGKGDVALMPKLVGLIQIQDLELTNLELSPMVVEGYNRPFSFAVQEGDQILLEKLSQGLNIIKTSGQYHEIYDKWFGKVEPRGYSIQKIIIYAVTGISGFSLIGIFLVTWSVILRRKVNARTKDLKAEILEHQRTEAALRESEARYSITLEALNNGIWDWHVPSGNAFFSPQYYTMLGYGNEEFVASYSSWRRIVHPEDIDRVEQDLQQSIETGRSFSIDLRMKIKSGEWLWVVTNGKAIEWDTEGKALRMVGTLSDITERKKAEETLRASNEMFSLFMQHSPIYIFIKEVTPTQSIVLQASDNYQAMIGMTGREIVGKNMSELFPPEFAAKITADDWAVVSNGEVLKLDEELNGRRYSTIKFPLIRGDKNLLAGYTIDITDRKQAEEEKAKLEAQLQQAQKMESVGRLAGGVAHDFNNMLSIIIGYAEMTLDALQPSDPLHENIQEIISAARRSSNVVRQLMAFARKQTIAPKVLDLNDTVEDTLKMLRRLIGEDIDLLWKPARDLWLVKMDLSQIDQLMANMVINARDAIKDVGKITIETANVEFDPAYCKTHSGFLPGEYVRLTVSDDGCGIDKEILPNIFEPFFTTKEVGKGTGLGLATIYGIVKQNNGFINVYSEVEQGSTFNMYFPRHQTAEANTEMTALPAESLPGVETVLLVEDEKVILKLGKAMLERLGYTVLTASTTDEAIRLARDHAGDIHLLMTDVIMPEMNGPNLAKQLTAHRPNLKSLFMSGYTANVIGHHGILEEGVHFIQKPFSGKDLSVQVRKALSS